MPLYYANQYFTTTLNVGGGIDASQTTGIVAQSISGVDYTKPGIACLTYSDPINTSLSEWITYTSINNVTKEFQGVTRGAEGYGAKTHANGAIISFPVSRSHFNALNDAFATAFDANFRLKAENLYATSTGSANAYVLTLSPVPASLETGMEVRFNANFTNTGAATINVNSLGAKAIKKNGTVDVVAGDIPSGQVITLIHDGTNFQVQGSIQTVSFSTPTLLTDGATVTVDHSLNTKFHVTLGGNRTIAFSNITTGKPLLLDLIQDGTGTRTVTWGGIQTDTVTMTIAAPGVVTTTKDMPTCTPIVFTTTGALPTGITAGTRYYWIRESATTGWVATTVANAQAATKITTSGSQSGDHTMTMQIRWGSTDTLPTLTTGKYRVDSFALMPRDATNGVVLGYTVGQDL